MRALSGTTHDQPAAVFASMILLALVLGCAAGPRAYRPDNLPPEYAALSLDTVETIDISRLSAFSVDSNLIDNGDLLEVSVVTPVDEDVPEPAYFRVNDRGMVSVPPIGEVAVAGLPPETAEAAIALAGIERQMYVTHPQVTVRIEEKKVNRVKVSGEVEEPGEVELRRGGSTLLAALVAAGGLTEDASLDVQIRRPARRRGPPGDFEPEPTLATGPVEQASYESPAASEATSEKVNLLQAVNQADQGYYLNDGDVVHVGKRPPRAIHVIGLVNAPGEYEIKPNEKVTVLSAIGKAGWKKLPIVDKVTVYRQVPDSEERIEIKLSLREAHKDGSQCIPIMPGDIVAVEETVATVAFETLRTFFRVSMGSSLGNMDLFQ